MKLFALMLILLNPFSQALYLRELFDRLDFKTFVGVHLRASVYSFLIFAIFALFGEPLLDQVFQVRLGSLRVFGGLINIYVAYRFITAGEGSTVLFRGDISDLAPNITLPYMVGPGMLWVSILMGQLYAVPVAFGLIFGVLATNMAFVLFAYGLFSRREGRQETRLAKYFGVLMRMMALFVGAIGVEMIVGGLQELLSVQGTS